MSGSSWGDRPQDVAAVLCCAEPWEDELVEDVASDDTHQPEIEKLLAWQVRLRVHGCRPVPPKLQVWFNRFTAFGGRVPQSPPNQKDLDREAVAVLQEEFDISKAEAIRHVADAGKRTATAIEANLYRTPYKKN